MHNDSRVCLPERHERQQHTQEEQTADPILESGDSDVYFEIETSSENSQYACETDVGDQEAFVTDNKQVKSVSSSR